MYNPRDYAPSESSDQQPPQVTLAHNSSFPANLGDDLQEGFSEILDRGFVLVRRVAVDRGQFLAIEDGEEVVLFAERRIARGYC